MRKRINVYKGEKMCTQHIGLLIHPFTSIQKEESRASLCIEMPNVDKFELKAHSFVAYLCCGHIIFERAHHSSIIIVETKCYMHRPLNLFQKHLYLID